MPPASDDEIAQRRGSGHSRRLPSLIGTLPYKDDPVASRQMLEKLIASMTEAMVVADAEGNVILHNAASLALHGFEEGEEVVGAMDNLFPGWEIADLDGNLLPLGEWPLIRALQGERYSGYEVRVRRRDESRAFVGAYSGTPILDENGNLLYALITIRDISEQQATRERMRESESRFRSVLESSLDAVYRRDLEGDCYDFLSPAIERITGFPPHEMNAMTMEEVWAQIHPDDRERVRTAVRQAVERGGQAVIEYRFRGKDGTYCWLADSFSVVSDDEGRPRYRGGTIRDISERKRAEEALRERERAFTTMANSIPQLAWMTDETGWIYWYNQRWYDYTGTTLEEVEGWGWQKVHHPDHVERVVRHIRHAFESGERWEDTFPLRGKDGEYRWFLSRALPIRDEQGRIVRWFGTNTDITERLQLERRLRAREAQLRELNRTLEERIEERTEALARSGEALLEARNRFFTLFHSSPVPTVLTAIDDDTLLDANAAYLDFFDLKRDEVVGRPTREFADIIKVDPAGREQLERLVAEQGYASNVELQLQNRSGAERVLLASVESAMLHGRAVAVATLIDITERRQAEDQARRLAAELALAQERERKRIAQILHDDVQQLLVALQIQLQMAMGADPDTMQAALASGNQYVEEIVELTRNLSGQLISPAQKSEQLQDNLAWLREFMSGNYGFTVDVEVAEPVTIPDPALRAIVLRLVRELLFNVVKHAETQKATVHAHMEEEALVIAVVDDGQGFDPAVLAQSEDGTGYGLLGMRNRLDLFGGQIEIESSPGEGTTVTLIIPQATLNS